MSGTLLAASPPARLVPIDLPQTTEAIEQLLEGARMWRKLVPQFEDHELAVLVWSPMWPGMPDAWETGHGLDPAVQDQDGVQLSRAAFGVDGYTNLEVYLAELSNQRIGI